MNLTIYTDKNGLTNSNLQPLDWFLNSQDPFELYKAQKSYILSQAVYLFGAVFALIHSFRQGGRWPYLYFAAIGHGIVVELISYFFPSVDNFWHSQTPINFIGQRLPLYIVFLCNSDSVFHLLYSS